MSQLETARLAWQSAQADLQTALAELEKRVAETANVAQLEEVRAIIAKRQAKADDMLNRYITHLGKS